MKPPARGQTSKHASNNTTNKRIRVLAPMSYEDMLAEDMVSAKRKREAHDAESNESSTSIGYVKHRAINPNFLGPILKKRFLGT